MQRQIKYLFIFQFFLNINSFGKNDSLNVLSFDDFLKIVKQNHPIAKQAELLTKYADATILSSKGNFDPKIFYDFKNKYYDNSNYYELSNGGFQIPTWFGIEFKAGIEQNDGSYINPENRVPLNGLLYSQISLPLLQGLIIDERRAILKQAKLFKELTEFEKTSLINDLLNKAGKAYWDWDLSYKNLKIHENAVEISKVRFISTKKLVELGDKPGIDSTEANIQLQDRIINLQQAQIEYRTKSLLLSNFLWIENNIPVEITENNIPKDYTFNNSLENFFLSYIGQIDSIINNHPNIQVYNFKIKQLEIEKKLKQEKLKPVLNLNYNPLFNPENPNYTFNNNYKWGVYMEFPIFLRKQRGELKITNIKIENSLFEIANKKNELLNKIKANINEYNISRSQIEVYSKNLLNYEKLWLSEKKLFNTGESSLFMINNREMSFINAQIKLNEIINKNQKIAIETQFSFGLLSSLY